MSPISQPRPLTIVNVQLKWISTILLLQLEDAFACTIGSGIESGFHEGLGYPRDSTPWSSYYKMLSQGFVTSADFEKAYNTITFDHALMMFELTGLPQCIIRLVSQLPQAPIVFCIHSVVMSSQWIPRAGMRWGAPFSPSLFALLASVVIPILEEVHRDLQVRMYVDDHAQKKM